MDLKNLIEANILFPAGVYHHLANNENLKIINILSYHQLLSFKAQNFYSLSKELFKKFLDHQETEIVSLYIFDTFGTGDTRNKVVDIFIKKILTGKEITIPSNEVKINLADVQPVCKSLINSINLGYGHYSIKSPDTISLEELAKMIMEISNQTVHLNRAHSSPNYFAEIGSFPENIFHKDPKYSLYGSLAARINEIQNDL